MLFGLILGKLKKYMYEEVIGTEKQYCLIFFQLMNNKNIDRQSETILKQFSISIF